MLEWLVWAHPTAGETDFIIDALETSLARIPTDEITKTETSAHRKEQIIRTMPWKKLAYLTFARWHRVFRNSNWQGDHHTRLWRAARWLDEPKAGLPRSRPGLPDALYAYRAGAATRDDLLDLFVDHPQGYRFPWIREFSGRKPHPAFKDFPILEELAILYRQRILEIETKRGELPTPASRLAKELRSIPGIDNLMGLLEALGKTGFERGYAVGDSRAAVLSHLIRSSYPLEEDTHEGFIREVRARQIPQRRLIELAVYAPQWAAFVESTLGWPQFSEAVWWVYAHTKDRQWVVDKEIREEWAARISEYTPLTADGLMDGAVDVTWFHQVHAALGPEHWDEIYRAAEYAASGSGHARARLFADALLGQVSTEQLTARIEAKRHQDAVRALGLIPLQDGENRQAEILQRYETLQEFLRTGKKFGSMRKASEKLAVSTGMENLARAAGYADPQRLEWAMEIEAITDLADGPITLQVGEVQLRLSIDDLGEAQLSIEKNGKALKSIPPAVKKDERIAGLTERKQQLTRQVGRMRLSLENAMCRGDEFSGKELQGLFRHPVLRVMLEQLIFVSPSGMGYPIENGRALYEYSSRQIPVTKDDMLRIASPLDLLESKQWHLWQRECFVAERIQPFKQVFRELYVLTKAEKAEGNLSRRYAGQQVNPRQALALFGTRGWVTDPEEGVCKTFHAAGITARVGFLQGALTPAEVEGLTIEAIYFSKRGEWKALPIEDVPSSIFSEVMRDVDLVVSVAHAGGVDPEASASSIEARSALIRETCDLLKLGNVTVAENHALIDGKVANYNVHLGSGVVHKQPGGALCIIPVHSQQRGRMFLPFTDDDPKTAEIVSKVLLLAKDDQIKDPTILEQILKA